MDNPVLHPPSEPYRVLAGGDGDFDRRGPHPGPTGCQNEFGGIVEDGMKISYELANDQ